MDTPSTDRSPDAAEEALRLQALGLIAGRAAHDFKNLLAIILGNVEMLEELLAEDPEASQMLGLIRSAGERGETLAGGLLGAATPRPAPGRGAPQEIAAGAQHTLQQMLGIRYEVAFSCDRDVAGAGPRLQSAVVHLGLGAHDIIPTGGRLSVRIEGTSAK